MADHIVAINKLMARALRALGDAGQNERASELAAEVWSLLREDHPKEAERMNGILHYLNDTTCKKNDVPPADGSDGKDFDLEVRHLPPAERHEIIFVKYHELRPGQGFILINDHDPIPLYYQFSFEYKDLFTWDPIEEGPEVWRVRIGKPE